MTIDTSKTKCPGQDTKFWKPEDIFDVQCAGCGAWVEFFKDEASRRCRQCGTKVSNPKLNMGCALWCEHAKECLGYDPKEQLEEGKTGGAAIGDEIIKEMKHVFGDDQKRITHALSVLDYAEQIMKKEGGNPRVIIAAALLHDIGIKEAERKHGSSAGKYQEMEGPAIAERILKQLNVDASTISDVTEIVGAHHSAKCRDTVEFRIIWDADWIVNIPDEFPDADQETIKGKIEKLFRTETGKELAIKTHIK